VEETIQGEGRPAAAEAPCEGEVEVEADSTASASAAAAAAVKRKDGNWAVSGRISAGFGVAGLVSGMISHPRFWFLGSGLRNLLGLVSGLIFYP
jgi:hypothetical protein